MGELDVGPADDPDGVDDVVGIFLESVLELRVDGQHGSRAEGIAGVDPHGVDVLDEADGDLLVLGVADDFQFELLPAQDRFLDQDLADEARRKPRLAIVAEFLDVVDETAAGAAHGVGGPDHHRKADPFHDFSASSS